MRALLAEGAHRALPRARREPPRQPRGPARRDRRRRPDRPGLARARRSRASTTLYHVAADYRLWAKDPQELYRANAGGTENILAAAADAGVAKVVYTSSVAALGLNDDGSPGDETTPVARERIIGHYKKSKYDAERVAEAWAATGLPVVIVNPSTPIGERDIKPTPTGPADRGLPEPAAAGLRRHGAEPRRRARRRGRATSPRPSKGRVGERYILGNRNMTLKEILDALARLTGLPAPTVRLPHWIPLSVAAVATASARG